MAWLQLKTILWKNYIIRKRHWLLTLMEVILPVIAIWFYGNTFWAKDNNSWERVMELQYFDIMESTEIYRCGSIELCYAPQNDFTLKLIENLQSKISLKVKPFKDEQTLIKNCTIELSYDKRFGVVFKSRANDKNFRYVILPTDRNTGQDLYHEEKYLPDGSFSPSHIKTCLAGLQLGLDTAYTEIISENKLPVEITAQQFPKIPLSGRTVQMLYEHVLAFLFVMIFSLLCPAVLKRVVEEKSTGFKELMKMKGMQSWMLWLGWFLYEFVIHIVSMAIVTYLLFEELWPIPIIDHSDWTVVFLFLILYCAASITFFFALSVFFYKPTTAIILGILIWLFLFILLLILRVKRSTKFLLMMLCPNMGLFYGLGTIRLYEHFRIGVKWQHFFRSSDKNITMEYVLIMFIVDIILYMLITFYIEGIFPGPYGIAKPVDFPIKYIRKKLTNTNRVETIEESLPNPDCKIQPTSNLKPSIRIQNLYKRYGKNYVAVNGLSIDIYDEQITALLGHNGAGKTTTMSIITGMSNATSGKILINDMDIRKNTDEVRNLFGLCPQHNLYSTDLTVIEHLMLFGMLKKLTLKQARVEAELLLTKLNIYNKRKAQVATLSGGMQRKVCLGMALMGDSKIFVLDEPTSGLDPESRRELWDMLLSYRGSHTIIITTHFMEEADVLGDRIAIMDHGQLVCYGTSMFLKNEYGAGYKLVLHTKTRLSPNEVQAITSVVRGKISNAYLDSSSRSTLNYFLPRDLKPRFGDLLAELENKKGELKIINISISLVSLEEVFLRVGHIKADTVDADATHLASSSENTQPKLKGFKLFGLQLWNLMKKRWYFFKMKWRFFAISMAMMLFITFFALYLSSPSTSTQDQSYNTFTYILNNYGKSKVFYSSNGANPLLEKLKKNYANVVREQGSNPQEVTSVSNVIVKQGVKDPLAYTFSWIIAAEFNASNQITVNAMYSDFALQSLPISLNLLMNAVLKSVKGDAYSISFSISDGIVEKYQYSSFVDLLYPIFSFGMILLPLAFLIFPHHEKATNVKQLQLMCGVSSASYWFSNCIFDFTLFFICTVAVVLSMLIYGLFGVSLLVGKAQLDAFFVMMLAYGLSALPYTYLFTYKKTVGGAFSVLLISGLLLMITSVEFDSKLRRYLQTDDIYSADITKKQIYVLSYLPAFGITYTMIKYMIKLQDIHELHKPGADLQSITIACKDGLNSTACIDFQRFFGNHESSIYSNVIIMVWSFVLFSTILLILEWKLVYEILEWIQVLIRKREIETDDKDDTKAETERIYEKLQQEKVPHWAVSEQDELLLVHQLQKIYKRRRVVKNVSFAVQPGECFGLLGVNGAGKSTTFRMLTGDLPVIKGKARILKPDDGIRIYLPRQSKTFLKNLGYCPQYNAINEVLTGRQMLRIFAQLRGMCDGVEDEINKWIATLGLKEYADKPCGYYSGGNKRKLCTALAFIASPTLIMLDEPTSGVDPVSRRKLWEIILALQQQKVKQSIILTSHGMDECEALCERLAIMKAGRIEYSGSIPNLKNQYGQGFTIVLQVKSATPITGEGTGSEPKAPEDPPDIKNLMAVIEQKYKGFCSLKDKHAAMLHYHISDTNKKLSQLFKEIEELKSSNKVIEDYSVNETTLEEIFLSIARA